MCPEKEVLFMRESKEKAPKRGGPLLGGHAEENA